MKRQLFTAFLLAGLTLCPLSALAHPPKAPDTVWSAATHTLTVKSQHVVSDPAKHYVMALVVLNSKGETLVTKQYTKQASAQSFSDTVQVKGILSGDSVKIRLICNIMGASETSVTLK